MLIKANHTPLFLVNSYYPRFTLALTNDSARQCESLGVVGMQLVTAVFRSLCTGLHVQLEVVPFMSVQKVPFFADSQKYIAF